MSDQTPTEPQPTAEPPSDAVPPASAEQPRGPRRLFRSRRDRVWAGVAGGLGEYFSVDPVIVRIAFAASVFIGGLGAFAYIALALFVPAAPAADGEPAAAPNDRPAWLAWVVGIAAVGFALSVGVWDARPFHGPFFLGPPLIVLALIAAAVWIARGGDSSRFRGPGGVFLRLVIAGLAFMALGTAAVFSAWAGATGHGVAVAVAIVVIGAGLILTAGRGNARWLVVPAIALAAPLGIVSASDVRFPDSVGDRNYSPSALADIPDDGYEFGVGRLAIDLRDADWQRGDVVSLDAELGVGELYVAVPSDVCVSANLDADIGEVRLPGGSSNGIDVRQQANQSSKATPRLVLDAHVDMGDIRLVNDDDVSIRRGRADEGSASDLRAACGAPEPTKGATDDGPSGPDEPKSPSEPDAPGSD